MAVTIVYPQPLKPGSTIGITAPSSGVAKDCLPRLDYALEDLRKRGFKIKEGQCLRADRYAVSASAKERAADFIQLWQDPEVAAIFPPWGGELLINILPHLSLADLQTTPPKWVMGYSDTSTLLYVLTTKLGIATAHSINLMDSILAQEDHLSKQFFDIMASETGESFVQQSSESFQIKWACFQENVQATFQLTEKTKWQSLAGDSDIVICGRLIGGCLDTVIKLWGTPYDGLANFKNKFKQDGVILFLENCELAPFDLCRSLWQLKLGGCFQGLTAIVLGRSNAPETTSSGYTYRMAVEEVLGDLNIPVIVDADIGHKPPQMTLINGAVAKLHYKNHKAELLQELR